MAQIASYFVGKTRKGGGNYLSRFSSAGEGRKDTVLRAGSVKSFPVFGWRTLFPARRTG